MGEKGAIVDAFVDRIEELAALEEQFADHQAAMAVIYGRRRIGKTALITEFVRDKRALYFLATEESEEQNRAAFQKQVAAFTGDELLGQVSVDNWDVLFDRLTSDGERLVVALDEFQYLGKANPAFPSVFQRIWDTMLSKRNVMVILCGSLISLMESQVLSYSSPLYGRRTAQVRMKQIPFGSTGISSRRRSGAANWSSSTASRAASPSTSRASGAWTMCTAASRRAF